MKVNESSVVILPSYIYLIILLAKLKAMKALLFSKTIQSVELNDNFALAVLAMQIKIVSMVYTKFGENFAMKVFLSTFPEIVYLGK